MKLSKILILAPCLFIHFNLSKAQSPDLSTVGVLFRNGVIEPLYVKRDSTWRPIEDEDYERILNERSAWYLPQDSGKFLMVKVESKIEIEYFYRKRWGFKFIPDSKQYYNYGIILNAPILLETESELTEAEQSLFDKLILNRIQEEEAKLLEQYENRLHYDSVTVVAGYPGIPVDEALRKRDALEVKYLFNMNNKAGTDKILYVSVNRKYPYMCGSVIALRGWILVKDGEVIDETMFGVGDCDGKGGLEPYFTPLGGFINNGKLYVVSEVQYWESEGYGIFEIRDGEVTKIHNN